MALKICAFAVGHGLKKGFCVLQEGAMLPREGEDRNVWGIKRILPLSSLQPPRDQHLLMFLEKKKSMVWWITNELKTAPAGREKGIFCLTVKFELLLTEVLHWPEPGRSSALHSWPWRAEIWGWNEGDKFPKTQITKWIHTELRIASPGGIFLSLLSGGMY